MLSPVPSVLQVISVLSPEQLHKVGVTAVVIIISILQVSKQSHRAAPYSSHPSRMGQSRSSGALREGHGPPLSHGTNWAALPPWTDMGWSSQRPLKAGSALGQKPGPWDLAHLTRFCLLCQPWGIWVQVYFRKNSVSFSYACSDWVEIADSGSGTDPVQIMVMFSAISTRGSSAH